MGLLDDAIREHLDLKRRRGADPAEVERDEREALGPVRRAPEALPSAEPDEQSAASLAYDHEQDDESWSHESAVEEQPNAAVEEQPDAAVEEQPAPSRRIDFAQDLVAEPDEQAPPPEEESEFEPETGTPELGDDDEPIAPRRSAGDETIEYDVEDPAGSDKRDDEADGRKRTEEDVLEETPEFLQDTPDHDRLWFEQRPPKDFDFDG